MLDRFDQMILARLQADADQSAAKIAEDVGLSTNACWRRIKKLEEDGVIRKRVALLDENELGLKMTVFVSVKTNEH